MPYKSAKGIVLEQCKEPALSRDLRDFMIGTKQNLERPAFPSDTVPDAPEILHYAREAHIIDERDGALLADKLENAQGVSLVVGDAIDDEPYVSSQMNPLFKLSKQAIIGLQLAAYAVGAETYQVAVYKNLYDLQLHIPKTLYGVRVRRITGKYPVEARAALNTSNVMLIGVCALIHLYRAVYHAIAQTTSFVTVAGGCVANPTNLEVSNGTTAAQVLERCGLFEEPTHIIIGGPMTGICVEEPQKVYITPITRAVLAFKTDHRSRNYHCIGCGRCLRACPQNLSPMYLYKAAIHRRIKMLQLYDVHDCTGCGTCSYVCPAKLDLSFTIHKSSLWLQQIQQKEMKNNNAIHRKEKRYVHNGV